MQVFIEDRGWNRSQVAKTMAKVYQQVPHTQREQLATVTEPTLSRWLSKGGDKPVQRHKFNAVVLAVLYLEWEASGSTGTAPGLQEVAGHWEAYCPQQPLGPTACSGSEASSALPSAPEVKIDLSDTEQVRINSAYGTPGTVLLQAARASDPGAALDLGLLRLLDGHRAEGEAWLGAAQSAGSLEAAGLLSSAIAPAHRGEAAARCALDRAARLGGAPDSQGKKGLLLAAAARAGLQEAAELLADHFDRLGDTGSAARWRLAASQSK